MKLRNTLLLIAALFFLSSPAQARHYKHHAQRVTVAAAGCNIFWPCEGVAPSPRGERVVKAMHGFGSAQKVYRHQSFLAPQSPIAGRPARYIGGRLVCAINVNAALAERGIKGTGSAAALSFLHWGRSAGGPVPGAVIVSSRRGGGHVAIVSRVENGTVYAWNATGGVNGWREIPYRHAVIDYRVPG